MDKIAGILYKRDICLPLIYLANGLERRQKQDGLGLGPRLQLDPARAYN
jgi:hypothetical protein